MKGLLRWLGMELLASASLCIYPMGRVIYLRLCPRTMDKIGISFVLEALQFEFPARGWLIQATVRMYIATLSILSGGGF